MFVKEDLITSTSLCIIFRLMSAMASSEYGSLRPGHLTPENANAILQVSFGINNLKR